MLDITLFKVTIEFPALPENPEIHCSLPSSSRGMIRAERLCWSISFRSSFNLKWRKKFKIIISKLQKRHILNNLIEWLCELKWKVSSMTWMFKLSSQSCKTFYKALKNTFKDVKQKSILSFGWKILTSQWWPPFFQKTSWLKQKVIPNWWKPYKFNVFL